MDALGLLQHLGAGDHIDDLHEALVMVAEEVVTTGRKGKVTVTYTIEKVKGMPQVIIDETIGKAPPKRDPRGAIAFILDGEFATRDPRAPELPNIREVERSAAEVKEVMPPERETKTVGE